MASARLTTEKHLSCPVCMDLLTDPRALPCMHTFCMKCLHSYIISVCNKGNERCFDCPVCRKATRPPFKGLHPYSWAENFPLNFAIQSICDDIRRHSGGNGNGRDMCAHHPEKVLEFFCEDHSISVCSVCAVKQHRQCENVHYLLDLTAHTDNQGHNQHAPVCHTTHSAAGHNPHTPVENGADHNPHAPGVENGATGTTEVSYPIELPPFIVHDVGPQSDNTSATENGHQAVYRLCKSASLDSGIDSHCHESDKLLREFANANTICDMPGRSEASNGSIKRPLTRLCGQTTNGVAVSKTYQPDDVIPDVNATSRSADVLEVPDGNAGGRFSGIVYGSYSMGDLKDIQEEEVDIVVVNVDPDVTRSQIQLSHEHYIRTQHDDKHCSVTGLTAMPDGRVILADENNSNVKMYDVNCTFIAHMSLTTPPWDIAAIEEYEAAVTCPNEKRVHILLVHDSLSLTRSIQLDKKCYGVAYCKKEIAVSMENEVRVLDYNGHTLHRIIGEPHKRKLFSIPTRKALFRGARYVCYDSSGLVGMLHVSDYDKSCVTSLDRKGGVMSKIRLGAEGTPLGMSVGERGQIFVCQTPNKLVTISVGEHGNIIKPLAEVDNILAVNFNSTSKLLWVTRRLCNSVKLYSVRFNR